MRWTLKKLLKELWFSRNSARAKKRSILFDWERVFSSSEMSGPYVQYAVVRLQAILQKADTGYEPDFNY